MASLEYYGIPYYWMQEFSTIEGFTRARRET